MDKDNLLHEAAEHCFFLELNDSGAQLCRANVPYGIAQIHHLQRTLGMKADATFIATPDMTVTRNTNRWKSGFGYGGKITWGSGTDELVVLNVKPNACGMLVGGLNELPDSFDLIKRMHDMEREKSSIDGVEVEWDFYKSNHFVNVLKVEPVMNSGIDLPPYAFIIHGSAPEFRGDNETGFGLYYDKSKKLSEMAQVMDGPFGPITYLTGDDAKRYFTRYVQVDEFTNKKRNLAASILFGEYEGITNRTHQGLLNLNEILLGCHPLKGDGDIFPMTLRGDLPAYLVRGKPNLSAETIESLGFEKRAQRLGVYERLRNANIVPHGGGYTFPDIVSVSRVMQIDDERYFEVEMQDANGLQIISDVKELPFDYRGRSVLMRSLELGLVEIAAKLTPQYVIKV
jgi:hypothetical protein